MVGGFQKKKRSQRYPSTRNSLSGNPSGTKDSQEPDKSFLCRDVPSAYVSTVEIICKGAYTHVASVSALRSQLIDFVLEIEGV